LKDIAKIFAKLQLRVKKNTEKSRAKSSPISNTTEGGRKKSSYATIFMATAVGKILSCGALKLFLPLHSQSLFLAGNI